MTLFLGVSLFIRPMMTLNIVAHFCGLILVILFYVDVGTIVTTPVNGTCVITSPPTEPTTEIPISTCISILH